MNQNEIERRNEYVSDDEESSSQSMTSSDSFEAITKSFSDCGDTKKDRKSKKGGKASSSSSEADESDSEDYGSDSDSSMEEMSACMSDTTLYGLIDKKQSFAILKIMIQMEFAEGKTLREVMDESKNGLDRKTIYEYFI